MNIRTKLASARDYVNGKTAIVVAALSLSPVGAAFAQSTDPSTPIVAEITKGQGYGTAAAVAGVVAAWAITAVWMARRKG